MTVEEIKAMFAETAAQMRETDRKTQETLAQMRETDRKMRETLAQMQETLTQQTRETRAQMQEEMRESRAEADRKIQETWAQIQKTDRQIDRVSKQMGGINENIGYHAEQFFQDVFAEKKVFGGIQYDEIIPNMKHGDKSGEVEFDIVLENCNSVAIIEVKNRIHSDFVRKLAEERFGKFRRYFPEYKDYDVYMGIAGFSFNEEVLSEAQKYGIGIIKQVGEGIEVRAEGLRAYR